VQQAVCETYSGDTHTRSGFIAHTRDNAAPPFNAHLSRITRATITFLSPRHTRPCKRTTHMGVRKAPLHTTYSALG